MPRTNGRSIYDFTQEEAWGGGRVVEGWPIAAAFCCWRLDVGRRAMEGEAGGLFGHRSYFKSIDGGEVLSLFVSPSTQSQSRQDERHDHHKPKRDDDKPLSRSFANLKAQAMPLGGGIDREIEIAKWRRRYVLEIGGIRILQGMRQERYAHMEGKQSDAAGAADNDQAFGVPPLQCLFDSRQVYLIGAEAADDPKRCDRCERGGGQEREDVKDESLHGHAFARPVAV